MIILLNDFLELWGVDNKTLLICRKNETEDIDDVINALDNFIEKKISIDELINDYIICAIDTTLTPFNHEYYLSQNIENSKVILFSTIDKYFFVFIE